VANLFSSHYPHQQNFFLHPPGTHQAISISHRIPSQLCGHADLERLDANSTACVVLPPLGAWLVSGKKAWLQNQMAEALLHHATTSH